MHFSPINRCQSYFIELGWKSGCRCQPFDGPIEIYGIAQGAFRWNWKRQRHCWTKGYRRQCRLCIGLQSQKHLRQNTLNVIAKSMCIVCESFKKKTVLYFVFLFLSYVFTFFFCNSSIEMFIFVTAPHIYLNQRTISNIFEEQKTQTQTQSNINFP